MIKGFQCIQAQNADATQAIQLIEAVFDEFQLGFNYPHVTADLQDLESTYSKGFFGLMKDSEDNLVGTFGLYPLSKETAEIRKMYLLPAARGKGLGKWMVQFLIDKAKALDYDKIELETSSSFTKAMKLYEKMGFKPIENCNASSVCNRAYVLALN